ncbi:MAG TPA: hypothetical protein VKA55_03185 [Gammaproteobacteria bacterium]|nr:hypothetical protein [Gammaproteobacteria bacterium]
MAIPHDLYDVWFKGIIEAVGRHDGHFDAGLAAKWEVVMTSGVDFIRGEAGGSSPQGPAA